MYSEKKHEQTYDLGGGVLLNRKGIIPVFVMTLTILIMLISIGYAALNQNLNISGEAFLRVQESVRISRIELSDATDEGYETYSPEYSKKGIKVYSTLPSINSKVTYNAQITNTTGAKYTVDSIEVTNTNANVGCTSSITKGSIIENGISDFTVEVKYKSGVELNEEITDVCSIKYEFIPLDLIPPTLDVELISQENNTAKIRITAQDEEGGSGLSNDNIYKYCLSTSSEEAKYCTWTNYVTGEELNITAPSNGMYYVLVYSIGDKAGNVSDGKDSIGQKVNKLELPLFNKITDYTYTGSEQTYTVPADGYYKIEAWGAQGWPEIIDLNTGLGGYTSGYIYLTKGESLYVYVGQGNGNGQNIAAFNNGTPNSGGYSGGGATDIRLVGGAWTDATSINSRIMVAGGGGAGGYGKGGAGGGLFGSDATGTKGGTQTSPGTSQTTNYPDSSFGIANGGCTGGNGYYPGGGATCADGAGGGSSFISGFAGVDAITSASDRTHTNNTLHYSGKYFINATMSVGVNSGNGKAKITYISKDKPKRVNTKLNGVRYIKDCMTGNTVNDSEHWVELQAIYQGKNIAKGKTVTATSAVLTAWGTGTLTSIVDGNIDTEKYSNLYGGSCITVDLGQAYDIDELAIWHYWNGNRIYFGNEMFVSSDNTNWTEVTMPTSKETSNGRRINAYEEYVQPLKLSINPNGGKYAMQENTVVYYVESGGSMSLLTPTKTGYTFTGWTVSGTGSSINGSTFTMGSANVTLVANWSLNSLYNILQKEYASGSGLVRLYTGQHNDTYNETGTENIYYFYGADDDDTAAASVLNKNNVLFGGFCWQMIRTTDTGGVKLIYNGIPRAESISISESEYNVASNDTNYPYTYDSTANTWTSTMHTHSKSGTIIFKINTAGNYYLNYTVSSETGCDKATFYKNDIQIGQDSGSTTGTIALDNLSTSDEIKVVYSKDSDGSKGKDNVIFSIGLPKQGDGKRVCTNSGEEQQIGTSAFNTNYNSPAYVGYMYNTVYQCKSKGYMPSSMYANSFTYSSGTYKLSSDAKLIRAGNSTEREKLNNAHYTFFSGGGTSTNTTIYYIYHYAFYTELKNGTSIEGALEEMLSANNINQTSSTIKDMIDTWYANNMTSYTKYLEDTVFCNDRSISSYGGWNPNGGSVSGLETLELKNHNISSDLYCTNETDMFSVGNEKAKLTYPVGLMTMPEMYLLGNDNIRKTGQDYFLASPDDFRYVNASVRVVGSYGVLHYEDYAVNRVSGVRPSVSLAPGTKYSSGTGSQTDPYVIP